MKNTHKKALGLAAVLTLAAVPMVTANTITLTENSGTSYKNGGAFEAKVSGANYVQYYSPKAIAGGQFLTFCVESQVSFNPGQAYNYSVAMSSSDGTALNVETAYLYYEFATGALGTLTHLSDYGLLQAAIWTLQGQSMPSSDFKKATASNNIYYALALQAPTDEGYFGVEILNLTDVKGKDAQNQLVYTGGGPTPHGSTVPDGGLTVILLGSSLAVMAWVQRRKLAVCRN
jgi:hypothetical protein